MKTFHLRKHISKLCAFYGKTKEHNRFILYKRENEARVSKKKKKSLCFCGEAVFALLLRSA